MELDLTTRRNLELVETMRGKEKKGSLLSVLDKTKIKQAYDVEVPYWVDSLRECIEQL